MELKDTKLFQNTRIDLANVNIVQFPNNFTIFHEGEECRRLGIVLEGKVYVKAYSLGGKNFTLNTLYPGNLFGDVLMFGNKQKTYPGSLITHGVTKIGFIDNKEFEQFLYHDNDLLKNFLGLLSEKAFEMNLKSKMLSQDSIRDKLLYWLQQQKRIQGTNVITLNMSKEELSNMLFVQRPSLSRELMHMKKEGLIDYDRHTITLKK